MRRREFITLLGSAAAIPLAAHAQPERRRLVGLLTGFTDAEMRPIATGFRIRLRELGWVEGRNVDIDLHTTGSHERIDSAARALVAKGVDVIVAMGTPSLTAVSRHSRTVPVVFTMVADPVGQGLIANLSRPGGNATGLTNFEFGIGGKWLEMLKQIDPRISRVTLITNPANPANAQFVQPAIDAGKTMGLDVVVAPARNAEEIERAITAAASKPGSGLIVFPDSLPVVHHALIIRLVEQHRIPAAYPFRIFTVNGGLMSYGLDYVAIYRQAADYVDRILRGTKPADLPVEAPNKFEMVINLKTAKALGLMVPASLLVAADEVIE
jgi:putative ABC transport system substrate-binding protein